MIPAEAAVAFRGTVPRSGPGAATAGSPRDRRDHRVAPGSAGVRSGRRCGPGAAAPLHRASADTCLYRPALADRRRPQLARRPGHRLLVRAGFLVAGLYWVANALLTKPEEFGWIAPLAPLGLPAILAPHPAIACALTRLAPRSGASAGSLCFAAAWTVVEWMRSWAYTGFPWNLIGSVWAFSDADDPARRGDRHLRPEPGDGGRGGDAGGARPAGAHHLAALAAGGRRVCRLAAVLRLRYRPACPHRPTSASSTTSGCAWSRATSRRTSSGAGTSSMPTCWRRQPSARPLRCRRRRTSSGRRQRHRCSLLMTRSGSLSSGSTRRRAARPCSAPCARRRSGQEPFQVWNSMLVVDDQGRVDRLLRQVASGSVRRIHATAQHIGGWAASPAARPTSRRTGGRGRFACRGCRRLAR